MNKNKASKWFYITTPILLFAIIISLLPVRTAVKILLIPGIPLMLAFDLAFYILPLAALAFLVWLAFLVVNIFRKKTKNFLVKTKHIPAILIIIVLVALLGDDITTYLYELDLSKVGLG